MNRYHRRLCRSTLPGRLAAAGFTRITVDADRRLVRFVAYTPGTEGATPA